MNVHSLGYVGIGVNDVARWNQFATDVLGLASTAGPDGATFLRMDERPYRVAVHHDLSDDIVYTGWEVSDPSALGGVGERLRAAGIPFAPAPIELLAKRRVRGLISCLDPDGISTEFFHGAASAAPFESSRALSGFVTGDQGVGHVVLAVKDAEATMAFYRDVLGFRISDFIEFERVAGHRVKIAFLHCNERHHSLAFFQQPAAPRRLSHLMLEARSLDDVGYTYSLCERQGVPIAMTLGRHSNDRMFSSI